VLRRVLQVFSSVPGQEELLHSLLMDLTGTFNTAMENGVAPSDVPDVVYQYCRLVNKCVGQLCLGRFDVLPDDFA
jgi:hypothetical protein